MPQMAYVNKGLRIYSFDGGGAGAIAELFILKEVLYRLSQQRSLDDLPLPCEYAELMAGCGLGGFIAILLGRLRLTIDQAIETVVHFGNILNRIYDDKPLNTQILRSELKSLLKKYGYSENLLMHDEKTPEGQCKVFVCATPVVTMKTCQRIRSYSSPLDRPLPCTVVDAALATMSSARYYSPVRIGLQDFVGASMGYNNPTREAIWEAWNIFGADTPVASILSLGAGVSPPRSINQSMDNLHEVLEDCDKLASELGGQYQQTGIYFRLSVDQGLQDIQHTGWDNNTAGIVESHTNAYIQRQTTSGGDPLKALEETLHTRLGRIAIAALNKAHTTPIYAKTVPLVTQYFIPREEIWKKMTNAVINTKQNKRIVLVLHGSGGVGKTQMVSYFVQQFRNDYVYIFYVDASSISSLQSDLTSAIRSLGVTYLHGTYEDALAFLSHALHIRWLLVYDNADDPTVPIERYLPQCDNGTVLITTRNAQHSGLAPDSSIEIGPMSEDEAVRALLRAAKSSNGITEEERLQAHAIVKELGCLPVAIVQAGRFCSASRNLLNYLTIFKKQPRKLLERSGDGQQDQYRYPSVFAALSVSHNQLSEDSKTLLHTLAFFHHSSDIPLSALRIAAESNFSDIIDYVPRPPAHEDVIRRLKACLLPEDGWDDLHIQDILDSLEKFSIISITKAATTQLLRFHPLTRVWAQSILQEQDKIIYWNMAVQIAVSCSSKSHKRLRRTLLPHIYALLDTPSELHPNSGAIFAPLLRDNGFIEKASQIWKNVRDQCISEHGPEHLKSIKATQHLANALRDIDSIQAEALGLESIELSKRIKDQDAIVSTSKDAAVTYQKLRKWMEAGELLQNALDVVIAQKGETSDDAIGISESLALSHHEQGHWSIAETLRLRVLEVRQDKLEAENPLVIRAKENLAETYLEGGRWKEAAKLQEDVLAVRSRLLGAAHPDTVTALSDLSITYQRLGKWNEAATLQKEILQARRNLLPKYHSDILEAASNLASTYCNQGHWSQAEVLQREVVEARERLLGTENIDSIDAKYELALTLYYQGRWSQSEELQEEVVRLRRKLLGEEHPDTLLAQRDLASNYSDQGRWKEAEKLGRQAVQLMEKVMGNEHPETLEATTNLAFTLCQQGLWSDAERIQKRMVAIYERTLGEEHPDTLVAMGDLAATYSELGQWLRAENLQLNLDKTCRRVLGEDHPTTLKAIGQLALTYSNMGRLSQSKDLVHKLVKVMRKNMGEEHPETLAAGVQLATVYMGMGKWTKSEKLLKQLVDTYRRVLGDEHPDTLTALTELAMVYSEMGRWVDAERMQIKTLETCRRVLGTEHPGTLTAYSNLATTQSEMGRWEEAKGHQKKVLEVRRRIWGEEHPDTLEAIRDLATTYSNMGKRAKAEALLKELVDVSNRSLGEEHPDTLAATIDLARVYSEMGRWSEAEALQREMVDKCERVLGEEHPDTLTARSDLASTRAEMGHWASARDSQEKILEARRRVLGDEHPDTLYAMRELAASYCQQAKWKEAKALQKDLVAVSKRQLGEEHPETLSAMGDLAETYSEMGHWATAANIQTEVVEVSERVLSPEHPDTITARRQLASSLSELGRWAEAEVLQKELVDICEKVHGPNHPETVSAISELATTYSEQGRWAEAEHLQLQVLDIRRRMAGIRHKESLMVDGLSIPNSLKSPTAPLQHNFEMRLQTIGEEHPDTLLAQRDLAATYCNTGRWIDAEKIQTGLIDSCERVFGPEHPETLTVISDLANTYAEMGKWNEAEIFQNKVKDLRLRILGDQHPDTVSAISDLAYTYSNQDRLKEAEKLQTQVVESYKRLLGDEHPDTLVAMGDLAATYSEMDRLEEAKALQVKLVEACQRVLGTDHPETLNAETNLATTLSHMNQWDEAAKLQEKTVEVYRRTLQDKHPDTLSAIGGLAHSYTKLGRWVEAEALQVIVVDGWRSRQIGHEHPRYKRANSLLQEIRSQRKESQSQIGSPIERVSSPPTIDQQPRPMRLSIQKRTEDDGSIMEEEDGVTIEVPAEGSMQANSSSTEELIPSGKGGGCCSCVII